MPHDAVHAFLERMPQLRRQLRSVLDARRSSERRNRPSSRTTLAIDFLLREQIPSANDVLVLNQALCIGCDNCEKACAETHGGVSRLDRQSGAAFAELHVPATCRHCDDPACADACPTSAIRRASSGEIYIEPTMCVGCGDCERACPFDAIAMASRPAEKPSLLKWLLFGLGPGPGEDKSPDGKSRRSGTKMPVKCDLCRDMNGGPVCVRACPTGAAFRANPEILLNSVLRPRHC